MARPEHIENARRVFSDNLALFVGSGRRFSGEAVSAATAMSPDTIRAALRGHSCPDWPNALALIDVLPGEFGAAVLRPAGLTGIRKIDAETTPSETLREIAEGAAALAGALADGRIDHAARQSPTEVRMNPFRAIRTALSRRRHARAVAALTAYNAAAADLAAARKRRDTRSINRAQAAVNAAMMERLRAGA